MKNQIYQNNINKKNVIVKCISCANKTFHNIESHHPILYYNESDGTNWNIDYQIIKCNGCNNMSFRVVSINDQDIFYNTQTSDFEITEHEELYPPRDEEPKKIDDFDLLDFTSSKIVGIYTEVKRCINNQLTIMSSIGLRTLLEAICNDLIEKEEMPEERKTLNSKIDFLVENQYLPKTSREVINRIRIIGNESTHESEKQDIKEIRLAMETIESLINVIYIYPKKLNNIINSP